MSSNEPPTEYFNGISYNPNFFQSTTGISQSFADKRYLQRTGAEPISSATTTLFTGNIIATGLQNTGSLTFPDTSSNVPTCSYLDTNYGGLNNNNIWNETNTFNYYLPTSFIIPSSGYELVNKNYADSISGTTLLSSSNIWTSTNAFNYYLPTSTIVPSTQFQFTNKAYVDLTFGKLNVGNTWAYQNIFTAGLVSNGLLYFSNSSDNYINYSSFSDGLLINGNTSNQLLSNGSGSPIISLIWSNTGVSCPNTLTSNDLINTYNFTAKLNSTRVPTTAYLTSYYAALASPTFTGIPKCPTAVSGTNTTQIASTAFVETEVSSLLGLANTWTGASNTFNDDIYVNSIQMGQGNTANLNTCFGQGCLSNNTGTQNTSTGYFSMALNTSGNNNTAYGMGALENNTTGSNNIAIGYLANQNGNFSNTTSIGYSSTPTANNQIVLGTASETTIIAGSLNVSGISTFGNNNLIPVGTIITTIAPISSYGYLRCDGSLVLGVTTYPLLFSAIGFTFNTIVVTTGSVASSGLYHGTIGAYTIQGQAGGISGLSVGMYAPYNTSIGYAYITAINIISFVITISAPLISTFTSSTVNWYNPSEVNYKLPDLRGAFLRGTGTNGVSTSYIGQAIGISAIDTIQSHTHTTLSYGTGATANQEPITSATINPANTTTTTSSTPSGNVSTETKPFNYSVYYYIRYL